MNKNEITMETTAAANSYQNRMQEINKKKQKKKGGETMKQNNVMKFYTIYKHDRVV